MPGLEEPGLDGPGGNPKDPGDVRLRPSGHEEPKHFGTLRRESREDLIQATDSIRRLRCDTFASGQERGEGIAGFGRGVDAIGSSDRRAPEHIPASVRRDRQHPLPQVVARLPDEGIAGRPDPKVGLLRRIVGPVATDVAGRERTDDSPRVGVQGRERFGSDSHGSLRWGGGEPWHAPSASVVRRRVAPGSLIGTNNRSFLALAQSENLSGKFQVCRTECRIARSGGGRVVSRQYYRTGGLHPPGGLAKYTVFF